GSIGFPAHRWTEAHCRPRRQSSPQEWSESGIATLDRIGKKHNREKAVTLKMLLDQSHGVLYGTSAEKDHNVCYGVVLRGCVRNGVLFLRRTTVTVTLFVHQIRNNI